MFTIRWKDTKASPAVRDFFESKLSKILRFKSVDADTIKAEIVYYPRENTFTVRLNVRLIGASAILRSEDNEPDVLTAINKVIDRTLDQIRRHKTRKQSKRQKK